MKNKIGFFFIFFPFFLTSEENLLKEHLKAEAYREAGENAAAIDIYQKLLQFPFSPWQRARLLYNLGTMQLSQQLPFESLSLFEKIDLSQLSLPSFGEYLFRNEGIAYLQYADHLASTEPSSLNIQAIFIKQSLRFLERAKEIDCQRQAEERQADFTRPCESSFALKAWTDEARLKLNQVFQKKREDWSNHASVESLSVLLEEQSVDWMNYFESVGIQQQSQENTSSYISYFYEQAESLASLWKALQQKEFSLSQKNVFEEALGNYQGALGDLKRNDISASIVKWKQLIANLNDLIFHDHTELHKAMLSYERALFEETPSLSTLKKIIEKFEHLKEEKVSMKQLEQIKKLLQRSLEAFENKQPIQAQIFFLAGYSQVASLMKEKPGSTIEILQGAIQQANRMLELELLSEMIEGNRERETLLQVLNLQNHLILTQAALFVPAVLKEQKILFHQGKDQQSRCQEYPWVRVIPLYDRGHRIVQQSEKLLGSFESQKIIALLEQVILNWQQALYLLLHPPSIDLSSASQKKGELIRQIQEMYLQDQPQPQQISEELHSW